VTIWIDHPAWPAHGRLWSHLVSDASYEELHDFAAAQGVPRRAFEGDHYDVPEERYAALVAAGAAPTSGKEIVRILQHSGLRIQKRRHERVVHSTPDAPWLPPGGRADVIVSRQAQAPSHTVVVRLAVVREGHLLLARQPDSTWDLPHLEVGHAGPTAAVERLVRDVLGSDVLGSNGRTRPQLLGYVRNTVAGTFDGYPWPVPKASFAVFLHGVGPAEKVARPSAESRWVSLRDHPGELSAQPWWLLLAQVAESPGGSP
jgi:Protein of unknown function (DUF4031)